MSTEEIIEDTSKSGLSAVDNKKKRAEVIRLFPNSETNATVLTDNNITYQANSIRQVQKQRIGMGKSRDISSYQIRNKVENELIINAYHLIVDALDHDIDQIERSNMFDEWKDYLRTITLEVSNLDVNHRKILGTIFVTSKDKDIVDFSAEELNILRDATYTLRQLRVSRNDSKRIIQKLVAMDVNMTIPLTIDGISDKEEKSLDQLISSLIERSK